METKTEKFRALGKDEAFLKKLKSKNKQEYIRKRVKAIEMLWNDKSRLEVTRALPCTYATLDRWISFIIERGLEKGLKELLSPRTFQKKQALSPKQKEELKEIVLGSKPQDHGIDRNLWTGEIICELVKNKWDITLKDSRIYVILHELGLSYQKAHRDYAEADKDKQKEFAKLLKKNNKPNKEWGANFLLR